MTVTTAPPRRKVIDLGADDRRSRLLAVEWRFHVIRADVVAVDRDNGALGRHAPFRGAQRRRDGSGHDSRLDDQAASDRIRGEGRLAPSDHPKPSALRPRDHGPRHPRRELDARDPDPTSRLACPIPSHARLNAPGPPSVPR